ncbi:MAG: hypothetical protein J0H15_11330 [Xanthomonadales bacterium]|nr:hypothetical protein [Xanthomonadales bacterium]
MRWTFILLALLWSLPAGAARNPRVLAAAEVAQLASLPPRGSVTLSDFPDGQGYRTRIHFQRIEVHAADARVVVVAADGEHVLAPSARVQLIGSDDSGSVRVHLAFGPGFTEVAGSGSSPSGNFVLAADGNALRARPSEEALPHGVTLHEPATGDAIPHPFAPPVPLLPLGDATAAAPVTARVAVDVDRELLVNRFGGTGSAGVTAANDWIADLFGTMNLMYQRDLAVTLQIGTVIMRTSGTPYAIKRDVAADRADLDSFGNYWEANHGNVPRAFAMLLSGQMTSGNSASGIAWLNSYCRKTSYGGSYSVNKVFTNPGVALDASARIVGHELGHNFGANHTHCSSAATGQGPVSTGTIDPCYKAEPGCWNGPVSCPTAGPGAPRGTVMSYCHMAAPNGANCGANVQQFHPRHVALLSTYVAQNTPACLAPAGGSAVIFRNGFER